jgi:hypothetical protein
VQHCSALINASRLQENRASVGGAVFGGGSVGRVIGSAFVGNAAEEGAGLAACALGAPRDWTIAASSFSGHRAASGGAPFFADTVNILLQPGNTYSDNRAVDGSVDAKVGSTVHELRVIQAPSVVTSGEVLTPAFEVELLGRNGNRRVTDNRTLVSVVVAGAVSGTISLSGGSTAIPQRGVASFADINMNLLAPPGSANISLQFFSTMTLIDGSLDYTFTIYVVPLVSPCAPGRYVSGQLCPLCPLGGFSNATIARTGSCLRCPRGRYAPVALGATSCSLCAPGTATEVEGQVNCACGYVRSHPPTGCSSHASSATPAALLLKMALPAALSAQEDARNPKPAELSASIAPQVSTKAKRAEPGVWPVRWAPSLQRTRAPNALNARRCVLWTAFCLLMSSDFVVCRASSLSRR